MGDTISHTLLLIIQSSLHDPLGLTRWNLGWVPSKYSAGIDLTVNTLNFVANEK